MKLTTMRLRAAAIALVVGGGLLVSPRGAKAVDLNELSKCLAFIEGFQYIFEFCQVETTLPQKQVTFARNHIGERRALIFAGLLGQAKKDQPGVPLKDLCKQGIFEGVIESEQESAAKETAAIRKAKN